MHLQDLKQDPNLNYIFLQMLTCSVKEEFLKDFQAFAPEIAEEILSAYIDPNPSCSCRKKIALYANLFADKCAEFLYNFVVNNNLTEEFSTIKREALNTRNLLEPPSVAGKIVKTSIKDWETFSKKVHIADFRGFSVLKEGEDLWVFFL